MQQNKRYAKKEQKETKKEKRKMGSGINKEHSYNIISIGFSFDKNQVNLS